MSRRYILTVAVMATVLLWVGSGSPAAACTSFCFDAPDGPVFGANMDLRWGEGLVFINRRGLEKSSYMVNTAEEPLRWVSRHGSVTFNLVGIEMPWGGMNEAGLVASTMQLLTTECPPPDERFPVSGPTWLQYMLDTCTTIDEVIAAQDHLRLHRDEVHFLVADSSGACLVVESLGGELILHAGDDLPVRALANANYHECLAYMSHGAPPRFNPGRSAERVAAADHWTRRFDPSSGIEPADWALGVLTEAVVDPKTFWKRLFREPYTRWSVAYDIPARSLRFRTVEHNSLRIIDFEKLDFGCHSPQLMMDVNAEHQGSVEDKFLPYDHQWNLEEAARFLDRWGVGLDDETARELVTFLESFPCAE